MGIVNILIVVDNFFQAVDSEGKTHSVGGKLQKVAISWNGSAEHWIIGPIGARAAGCLAKPLVRIPDVVVHIFLALAKLVIGATVMNAYRLIQWLRNKESAETHCTCREGVLHAVIAMVYAIDIFACIALNLINPNIYIFIESKARPKKKASPIEEDAPSDETQQMIDHLAAQDIEITDEIVNAVKMYRVDMKGVIDLVRQQQLAAEAHARNKVHRDDSEETEEISEMEAEEPFSSNEDLYDVIIGKGLVPPTELEVVLEKQRDLQGIMKAAINSSMLTGKKDVIEQSVQKYENGLSKNENDLVEDSEWDEVTSSMDGG